MDHAALERLRDDPIDWRYKGFPPADGVTPRTFASRGWNVLAGDLMLAALVLRESALAHDLDLAFDANDQHLYVRLPADDPLDLLGCGISHPCTAFDKWRLTTSRSSTRCTFF